jgi:hypothetical protein
MVVRIKTTIRRAVGWGKVRTPTFGGFDVLGFAKLTPTLYLKPDHSQLLWLRNRKSLDSSLRIDLVA